MSNSETAVLATEPQSGNDDLSVLCRLPGVAPGALRLLAWLVLQSDRLVGSVAHTDWTMRGGSASELAKAVPNIAAMEAGIAGLLKRRGQVIQCSLELGYYYNAKGYKHGLGRLVGSQPATIWVLDGPRQFAETDKEDDVTVFKVVPDDTEVKKVLRSYGVDID